MVSDWSGSLLAWDAEFAALKERIGSVLETLSDDDGVLVVDETGFLKKGEHAVDVARRYSGTAGRIENCRVGVFVAFASRFCQALTDRRPSVPDARTRRTPGPRTRPAGRLRHMLEVREQSYGLAVRSNHLFRVVADGA